MKKFKHLMLIYCLFFFYFLQNNKILLSMGSNDDVVYKLDGNGFNEKSDFKMSDMKNFFFINKKKFLAEDIEFTFSYRKARTFFSPKEQTQKTHNKGVYLRIDSRAIENNKRGFKKGEWIPASKVNVEIKKKCTDNKEDQECSENNNGNKYITKHKGSLFLVTDRYGIHYGNNFQFFGKGNYIIIIAFYPPKIFSIYQNPYYTKDEEASVNPIFEYPIRLNYEISL